MFFASADVVYVPVVSDVAARPWLLVPIALVVIVSVILIIRLKNKRK